MQLLECKRDFLTLVASECKITCNVMHQSLPIIQGASRLLLTPDHYFSARNQVEDNPRFTLLLKLALSALHFISLAATWKYRIMSVFVTCDILSVHHRVVSSWGYCCGLRHNNEKQRKDMFVW